MATAVTPPAEAPARRRRGWRQLPVVHQLRQSVGLQRGMLVTGLVLSAVFVLAAIFAPLLAPYGYNQLRDADIFGKLPIGASFTNADGQLSVQIVAAFLVLAMTATTFLTQRQLMAKNMPKDALSGPYAQQQKMLLYVLPVVFAVGGIAFPIGVLFYWTTSNLWTMGQQFYVIRNNPAPGTEAERAKIERDRKKAEAKGLTVDASGAVVDPETVVPEVEEKRPAQRQQPKRQTKSQRKGGGSSPAGNQRAANQKRNGNKQ